MKLWKRRIILIISILFFIILSPTIILYSSGYRLNIEDFSLKKVGMIIIESVPKEANVIINNKFVADRTPYKKYNLTPKNYYIKLEKENYQSYGKNLSVKSQTVTWITNAILFLTNPLLDKFTQEKSIIESKLSPDQEYYSYISKTKDDNLLLRLLEIDSRENNIIFDLKNYSNSAFDEFNPLNISNILWSNNSQYIALTLTGSKYNQNIIIDTNNLDKRPILLSEKNIQSLKWDINDENFIFYIVEKQLKKINIRDQDISNLIAKDVSHFDLVENSILYTKNLKEKEEQFSSIYLINKNKTEIDNDEIYESLNIINEEIVSIKARKEDLYLFATEEKTLYLVEGSNIIQVAEDIKDYIWSSGDHFLYHSEKALGHYKIEEDKDKYHPEYKLNEPVNIVKTSKKIQYVDWHPDDEHILYSVDNKVNIIELDNRDTINNFEVLNNTNISNMNPVYFNDDGDKIFFLQNYQDIYSLTQATLYQK